MTASYTTPLLLTLVAVLLYLTWSWAERRKAARADRIRDSVAALGDDAVPASLHPKIDPDRCIGSGACVRACPEHDVIGLIGGRVHLVNPLACVGHGACMAACPVKAIELVFGTAKRGVELPMVGPPDFQTSQPGVYVIGELAGMGLIRNAVEQGRQVASYIAGTDKRGSAGMLDALVVGAGPAGTSATLALRAKGLEVRCVEQDAFGGTIQHYPRAKVVMTGTLELEGFGRIKRKTMTKEQLVALWDEIARTTELPVETGVRVTGLTRESKGWLVEAEGGRTFRAANVVLALGRRGSPRRLEVPGEELAKVHYRLIETAPFRGRHVLVVGGGNAAAESVLALADDGGCRSLALSYRRAELARLRGDVRVRLERHIAAGTVEALLPSEVASIDAASVTFRDGTTRPNDALIVQIGGTPPSDLLATFGIRTVVKRGTA